MLLSKAPLAYGIDMRRWTGTRFVGELEPGEEPPLMDISGLVEFKSPSREQLQQYGFEFDSPEYREAIALFLPLDADSIKRQVP